MSKLNELIEELCPDGVEYKRLKEVGYSFFRGNGIKRTDITESGIPCVRYGEIYTEYGIWFDECKSHTLIDRIDSPKYFGYGAILFAITGENIIDIAKCTAYTGHEKCLAGGDIVVMEHNEDPKYLSYALSTTDAVRQKGAGKVKSKVVHSSIPAIMNLEVPVPPVEVQREIVRVLDNFTLLRQELSAELSARRKQYEYYRDELLTFDVKIPKMKLGETCSLKAGKAIPSEQISNERTEDTPIECYGGNGIRGYVADYNHDGEFPIIGRQGALCGNITYAAGKFYATEHAVVVKSRGLYLQRFLYHLLTHMNLNQYKSAGAQPGLSVKNLVEIDAPVPSIDIQNSIVSVLDNFEAICNDLNIGLPAEIEARTKQYNFYRDQLLTFAESGKTILTTGRPDDRTTGHDAI